MGCRIYHVSQCYVQEHPSSQSEDPVGREVAAGHDAKGQAHVAAAGGDEVEEERLANGHPGVQQDHKVPCGRTGWEGEEGRADSSIGTAAAWARGHGIPGYPELGGTRQDQRPTPGLHGTPQKSQRGHAQVWAPCACWHWALTIPLPRNSDIHTQTCVSFTDLSTAPKFRHSHPNLPLLH